MVLRYIAVAVVIFCMVAGVPSSIMAQDAKQSAADMEKKRKEITEASRKGDADSVIKLGEEYLKTDAVNLEVLLTVGEAYAAKNNFTRADELAKKAVTAAPTNTWALVTSAKIQRINAEQGKVAAAEKKALIDSAEKTIEKALTLNPKDAWVNAEAALISLVKGDKAKATKLINVAIEAAPSDGYIKGVKQRIEAPEAAK